MLRRWALSGKRSLRSAGRWTKFGRTYTAPEPEPMSQTELHDAISRLEARLEELADAQANCRKMIMASRFAVGGAALWLLGMVVGVFPAEAVQLTTAISVFLGGIVFFGSNTSTLEQTTASIQSIGGGAGRHDRGRPFTARDRFDDSSENHPHENPHRGGATLH